MASDPRSYAVVQQSSYVAGQTETSKMQLDERRGVDWPPEACGIGAHPLPHHVELFLIVTLKASQILKTCICFHESQLDAAGGAVALLCHDDVRNPFF